jgi:D-3-phosphoglycerate dehydrogenase
MQNCIEQFRHRFDDRGIDIEIREFVQQPTEDELIAIIGSFEGMIAGDDPLTARVLEHATRMRIISKWGVGVDGIDLDAARRLEIAVTNTPSVFGDDVADVAAGYLVLLARQLHRIHESVTDGGWWKWEGTSLAGKTLGIAGFGSIGRAVAQRGRGFGMEIAVHDVTEDALNAAEQLSLRYVDRGELFAASDFLVLCCPLTPTTQHMVNAETLGQMKRGSFLVNVARGPLVDEQALVGALDSGQLSSAALDVFEKEPLPLSSPLRAFKQCVFGSHNGSNTTEGVLRASARAVDNVLAGLGS